MPPEFGRVGNKPPPSLVGAFVGCNGFVVRDDFAINASAIDVDKKMAAKITVVRVRALAAPRPVMRPETPPPVPSPSPPPSER